MSTGADGKQYPTMVPPPGQNYELLWFDNRYFMPRLGFAYRLTDKWVIRSGSGWFANVQQMNNMTILALQPPFSGTNGWNAVDQAAMAIAYPYAGKSTTCIDAP